MGQTAARHEPSHGVGQRPVHLPPRAAYYSGKGPSGGQVRIGGRKISIAKWRQCKMKLIVLLALFKANGVFLSCRRVVWSYPPVESDQGQVRTIVSA